jgi:hypothetical protein
MVVPLAVTAEGRRKPKETTLQEDRRPDIVGGASRLGAELVAFVGHADRAEPAIALTNSRPRE